MSECEIFRQVGDGDSEYQAYDLATGIPIWKTKVSRVLPETFEPGPFLTREGTAIEYRLGNLFCMGHDLSKHYVLDQLNPDTGELVRQIEVTTTDPVEGTTTLVLVNPYYSNETKYQTAELHIHGMVVDPYAETAYFTQTEITEGFHSVAHPTKGGINYVQHWNQWLQIKGLAGIREEYGTRMGHTLRPSGTLSTNTPSDLFTSIWKDPPFEVEITGPGQFMFWGYQLYNGVPSVDAKYQFAAIYLADPNDESQGVRAWSPGEGGTDVFTHTHELFELDFKFTDASVHILVEGEDSSSLLPPCGDHFTTEWFDEINSGFARIIVKSPTFEYAGDIYENSAGQTRIFAAPSIYYPGYQLNENPWTEAGVPFVAWQHRVQYYAGWIPTDSDPSDYDGYLAPTGLLFADKPFSGGVLWGGPIQNSLYSLTPSLDPDPNITWDYSRFVTDTTEFIHVGTAVVRDNRDYPDGLWVVSDYPNSPMTEYKTIHVQEYIRYDESGKLVGQVCSTLEISKTKVPLSSNELIVQSRWVHAGNSFLSDPVGKLHKFHTYKKTTLTRRPTLPKGAFHQNHYFGWADFYGQVEPEKFPNYWQMDSQDIKNLHTHFGVKDLLDIRIGAHDRPEEGVALWYFWVDQEGDHPLEVPVQGAIAAPGVEHTSEDFVALHITYVNGDRPGSTTALAVWDAGTREFLYLLPKASAITMDQQGRIFIAGTFPATNEGGP